MKELTFKYGCNPNQNSAKLFMRNGDALPLKVINGNPGYINLMDALNAWQLVRELKLATNTPAAASFKHVSPAGASIYRELTDDLKSAYHAKEGNYSQIAIAYIRARGSDRLSSYGDFVAVSDECDESLAKYLASEVSDGIIAPRYSEKALEILNKKRSGRYTVLEMDPNYYPTLIEQKDLFGLTLQQERNNILISDSLLENIPTINKELTVEAKKDLILAMITAKYTQSNSICYAKDGQTIGIGAGQQSRIHCTRLAGDKADNWHYRQHKKVLSLRFLSNLKRPEIDNAIDEYIINSKDLVDSGRWASYFAEKPKILTNSDKLECLEQVKNVALASDAFFPFGDNIERAYRSGVKYIAQTGGSIRDDHVINKCNEYGIVMAVTGVRLFHH